MDSFPWCTSSRNATFFFICFKIKSQQKRTIFGEPVWCCLVDKVRNFMEAVWELCEQVMNPYLKIRVISHPRHNIWHRLSWAWCLRFSVRQPPSPTVATTPPASSPLWTWPSSPPPMSCRLQTCRPPTVLPSPCLTFWKHYKWVSISLAYLLICFMNRLRLCMWIAAAVGLYSIFILFSAAFVVSQLNRSLIPAHSVYAPAVERVIHRLWHPDPEEDNAQDSKRDTKPEAAVPPKPRPACNTWLWLWTLLQNCLRVCVCVRDTKPEVAVPPKPRPACNTWLWLWTLLQNCLRVCVCVRDTKPEAAVPPKPQPACNTWLWLWTLPQNCLHASICVRCA